MQRAVRHSHIVARENNILRVDFSRDPDPPAPKFPGAAGLREIITEDGAEPVWSRPAGIPRASS